MRGLIGRLPAALLVVLLAAPATMLGPCPAVLDPADPPPHTDGLAPTPVTAPSVEPAVAPTSIAAAPPALDVRRPPSLHGDDAVLPVADRPARAPARARPGPRVLRL